MPQDDFQRRLERLNARTTSPEPSPAAATSPWEPATTRKEKLHRALSLLAQNGVKGAYAYSPIFRGLARIGLPPKPMFFWSPIALVLFGWALFIVFMGGGGLVAIAMGQVSGPVRGMVDAGPAAFFSLTGVMSVLLAAWHKLRARQMGLPRWRDL